MMKVGGKQKPFEMWQAGNSLAASPLVNSLVGFAREYGGSPLARPLPHPTTYAGYYVFDNRTVLFLFLLFVEIQLHVIMFITWLVFVADIL